MSERLTTILRKYKELANALVTREDVEFHVRRIDGNLEYYFRVGNHEEGEPLKEATSG